MIEQLEKKLVNVCLFSKQVRLKPIFRIDYQMSQAQTLIYSQKILWPLGPELTIYIILYIYMNSCLKYIGIDLHLGYISL